MTMRWIHATSAIVTAVLVGTAGAAVTSGQSPSANPLPSGWLVMERFGQAPDGSTTEFDFDRRQLWLVRTDGTELQELSPGRPPRGKTSPEVSPDGTRIAFSTWSDPILAWDLAIDGSDLRQLSTDCSGRTGDCRENDPAYSPDGRRVAVVRTTAVDGERTSVISIHDLIAGTRLDLTGTRVDPVEATLAQPSWSPDGTRIAYHRAPRVGDAYPAGITGWIASVATGEITRLVTPDGEDTADLHWAPDGTRIVYSTIGSREFEGRETPPARIVSIHPDGTDPIVLCDARGSDQGCWAPSWLPDGRHVLYYGFRTWNLVGNDGTGRRPIDPARLTWFGSDPGQGYGYVAVWAPDAP